MAAAPDLAEAHSVLGNVLHNYEWDWPGAEREYRRALDSNPSHLLSRLWYAECLARMNRHK